MSIALKITLIALLALSAVVQILTIGQERKPNKPGPVAFGVTIDMALIFWILQY